METQRIRIFKKETKRKSENALHRSAMTLCTKTTKQKKSHETAQKRKQKEDMRHALYLYLLSNRLPLSHVSFILPCSCTEDHEPPDRVSLLMSVSPGG